MRIELSDRADAALVTRLHDELHAHNTAFTGIRDGREILATIRTDGEPAGAAYGWTWGGSAYLDTLWVAESHRGRGAGTQLLEAFVEEVRARGCRQILLTTHSFQAPDFYRRFGFVVAGEIPEHPAGHSFLLMRLALT